MEKIKLVVKDVDQENMRLDYYLSSSLDAISRTKVQNLIKNEAVKVNNIVVTRPSFQIKSNDILEVKRNFKEESVCDLEPQDIDIRIIHEDKDIIVIDKARGMVVHPGAGNRDKTLVNALLYHDKELSTVNGSIRPGIVHRLDKNTTGIIIVAKNDVAHAHLSQQFASRELTKRYLALVDGSMKIKEGIIEKPIVRHKYNRKIMDTSFKGRYAKTTYKVLESFDNYTLISLDLYTGRTHQIRVHCKSIGHPIVGDKEYGGSNKFLVSGQLLHSQYISFTHPTQKINVSFEAPPPKDFLQVIEYLRQNHN